MSTYRDPVGNSITEPIEPATEKHESEPVSPGEQPGEEIRVVVVTGDHAVLQSVSDIVSSEPAMRLVGTASDEEEAIVVCYQRQPHVVLVDVHIPRGSAVQAVRALRLLSPESSVVALSTNGESERIAEMVNAGASGATVVNTQSDVISVIRASVGSGSHP